MNKKNLLCFLSFFVIFFNIHNSFANNSVSLNMPQYTASFKFSPLPVSGFNTLVLRYYQEFGDGSRTGWQTLIKTLPEVILNGAPVQLSNFFSYYNNYLGGAWGLGYDQYAQYYGSNLFFPPNQESILTITGTFEQVAYLSAVVYTYNGSSQVQQELLDRQMNVTSPSLNPYIKNHPSVFYYPQTISKIFNNKIGMPFRKIDLNSLNHLFVNPNTGKIDVYRLDQADTQKDVADDVAPDGCSRAYLFAQKNSSQSIIILRIKVPKTFIENNHPDKIFKQYQARYFSIGAHHTSDSGIELTYWTVNARMLKDFEDVDGYAYVFFAPDSYTNNLAIQQGTPPTEPPVMTWGQYKGYLLGDPNFAIIIRYRDPNPHWQGSPENAVCYATPDQLKPVTRAELGDYLPEIYGDTLDHFNNGHIGIVRKDAAWPIIR